MSKISEQKALEEYPIDIIPDYDTMGFTSSDRNEVIRLGYTKGYDQAIQDFLEYLKYCSTFTDMNGNARIDNDLLSSLTEDLKNYIENESEN